jgi:hypothetical protein
VGMKDLIKKILKEDTDFEIVKRTVTKLLEKKVKDGEVPTLNFNYLKKMGLTKFYDEIRKIYYDFVGGPEEAFKLFKKSMEGKIITKNELKNAGISVHPEDNYIIKITRIFNPDYRGSRVVGSNSELEFGFDLLDGEFITDLGVLTLEELYREQYESIWYDVENYLKYEMEDYVWYIAENEFGLEFDYTVSSWDN